MYLLHSASSLESPDGPVQCQAVTAIYTQELKATSPTDTKIMLSVGLYIDMIEN
jgi:FtsH-binding integral membrane protein